MRKICSLALCCAVALSAAPAVAGELRLDAAEWSQYRKNAKLQRELPTNTYLGGGVTDLGKWHVGAQTDMRFFRDLKRSIGDYDLYQGLVHAQPSESVQFDLGRQFVSQGFSAEILDGVRTTVTPFSAMAVTAYAGVPRSVDRGDFNKNDGFLSGLSIAVRNIPKTNLQLHTAWRKNDLSQKNWRENDTLRVGADLSHQFGGFAKPMVYGLIEYDAAGKLVETGTVGVDVYPSRRVAINLEGNYFNINRSTTRPTIMSLFTQGPLWTARASSTIALIPGWVDLVERYAYQRVELQTGVHRSGHLVDIGPSFTVESIGLAVEPGYYYEKSFGGRVHGVRLAAHEEFTPRLTADAGIDYATYRKVTNDNDNAFSSMVWAGYEIVKGWKVSAGVEYNKNNAFNRDVRGSLHIDYRYGKKI